MKKEHIVDQSIQKQNSDSVCSSHKGYFNIYAPGNEGLYARMRHCGHYLFHRCEGKTSQQRILSIIHHHGDVLSQRALLDILHIRSASISEILGKLENQDYITRSKNQEDRRNVDIKLTQKGMEVLQKFQVQHENMLCDLYSVLDDKEKEILSDILGKLIVHWENEL